MAALIGTNISYLLLAFLPPIAWLIFYLKEDRHPEPRALILFTFIGGMAAALLAVVLECVFVGALNGGSCRNQSPWAFSPFLVFAGIALIEEYTKYLAVRLFVLKRCDGERAVCEFDEPVDAMIYMMTAAMGFAALENALFIFPIFFEVVQSGVSLIPFAQSNVFAGLDLAANRFLGANLLHALSSAIVGFFLARAWFQEHRTYLVAVGLFLATLLHASFNYLILTRETFSEGTFYIILLLSTMAVIVFIQFERLRKTSVPKP